LEFDISSLISLTPALSPVFGGEGKGEGVICKDFLRKGFMPKFGFLPISQFFHTLLFQRGKLFLRPLKREVGKSDL